MSCDYCHEDSLELLPRNGFMVCRPCRDYAVYYDALSPERKQAEEDWTAQHVLDDIHHGHVCDCEHRHPPVVPS